MSEPALFAVDPYRDSMLSDVKPGEWFSWPDRRHWYRMLSSRYTDRGNIIHDRTGSLSGKTSTGGGAGADRPVLIYNGTPPAEERAT